MESPQRKSSPSKKAGNVNAASGQIAKQYEAKGLKPDLVELEHLRTVETEVKREREVNQSLQADVAMLQAQVKRSDEHIKGLEKVRSEQADNISMLERVRGD